MTTDTQENETDTTRDTPETPGALDGEALSLDLKAFGLEEPESPVTQDPPAETRPEPRSDDGRTSRPKGKGDLRKALHEERGKAREANERAEHYRQIAEDVTKRTATQDPGLNLRGTVPQSIAAPKLTAAQKQELFNAVEQAQSLGKSTEVVIDTVERMFESHAATLKDVIHEHVVGLERSFRQRDAERLERAFMRDNPDYRETVQRANLTELITVDASGKPGPHYNPRVAQAIADAENPIEAAYLIAKGLIGETPHRASASGRDEFEPSPSPDPDRPSDRRPAATDRPAPAERRPAPGSERVDSSARPRTVRDLPSAGAPQTFRLDDTFKTYLDEQWKKNPEGVMGLFGKRPDIQRWYEGG